MSDIDPRYLRRLYTAIVRGYSKADFHGVLLFFRHPSLLDQSEIDDQYSGFKQRAVDQGLLTKEARLAALKVTGAWGDKEETELAQLTTQLSILEETKKIGYLPSQIEEINIEIKNAQTSLDAKKAERDELVGYTAESFADRRINEVYIYESSFKDERLSEHAYSKQEFEDLETEQISELVMLYNSIIGEFNEKHLKHIALNAFFQNIFALAEEDMVGFLGKPIVYFTYYQSELINWGRYFRFILSSKDNKPPAEIAQDPDKLVDWMTGAKNVQTLLNKNVTGEGEAMSIVGATASDLKAMGIEPPEESIAEKAKKKGGSLNMQDMMLMGGITEKLV